MAIRESIEDSVLRWKKLELVQKMYPTFSMFLEDAMSHIGFKTTWMQHDIASFVEKGGKNIMIQAQRAEAKTTITAMYAVYSIIHDPSCRVLIVSSGETMSSQISTLIIRLIMTMDELECLRPDRNNGDRASVAAFDIHYTLKGPDKSPSIACVGVMGSFTGFRADLLIADDVESKKNSITDKMREALVSATNEFPDIVDSGGRIIYLGTPQTIDSIYNRLPSRGFTLRIWPGRYPTKEQRSFYGDYLAPSLVQRMEKDISLQTGGGVVGEQGQATDPERRSEAELCDKELSKGSANFQLQYMLNTSLMDKSRYPLKTTNLLCMNLDRDLFPMSVIKDPRETSLKKYSVNGYSFQMSSVYLDPEADVSSAYSRLQSKLMYVDPAGGGSNGDETAYCVLGFLNSTLYLLCVGGIPGGYAREQMDHLTDIAKTYKPDRILVEKNFGYGGFSEIWKPILRQEYDKCGIDEDMVHGMKEKRIESVLGPVIGRHSLVIGQQCLEHDELMCERYRAEERKIYSFFFQFSKLMLVKNALVHDDRLDCVAGAVNQYMKQMAIDQSKAIKAKQEAEFLAWRKDPLGKDRYTRGPRKRVNLFYNHRK